MSTTIKVKKISEDSGFCREYYKNIENNRIYAKQEEFKGIWKWYTTTSEGEPSSQLKSDITIEIVGNWEETKKEEEKEMQEILKDIRRKVNNA
jgi:hypothetical protein